MSVILFFVKIAAQPQICGPTPAMTSFCTDACIICDIDGFTGRNNSSITGQAPPGFCTSYVHHMQWIGFIAGTTNLTLEVRVSNCNENNGLEIGLYYSSDCINFSRISDCDTDIRPGEVRVFKNTVPLVVGQYYYFVMDGSDNDICDWSIKVTNGSTKVAPLETAPEIMLPARVCSEEEISMETPGITGATFYDWVVDGVYVASGKKAKFNPDKPGIYNICLDASNVCDEAPRICRSVEVLPLPQSIVKQQICFGECFNFFGEKFCQTGIYDHHLAAANGCDSIVTLDLIVDDQITASTSINICDGDTLRLGNGVFYTEGTHQTIIDNDEDCNIYMTVNLKVIQCNIKSGTTVSPPLCNGDSNGSIAFFITNGTPPLHYTGYKLENSSVTFSGDITSVNEPVNISGLDAGSYYITTVDEYGNSNVTTVLVPQPSRLTATSRLPESNGYNLLCHGDTDGYVKILPAGGTPPYTYYFEGVSVPGDSIPQLAAGEYTAEAKDINGCVSQITIRITQPEPLTMDVTVEGPDCTSINSANLTLKVQGGVTPYTYTLDQSTPGHNAAFNGVGPGSHMLVIQDASGCTDTDSVAIREIIIPEISVGTEEATVKLGDSLQLQAISNITEQTVLWSPSENIACPSCLLTAARPVNDTEYEVTVVSTDRCETKARIKVTVDKIRSFVISNVFTPNNDGVNDFITYYAGNDVKKVLSFRIYDRWGNLVWTSSSDSHGISEIDWDGNFRGQKVMTGIYTWICDVEYIDAVIRQYKGSLTILR